MNPPRPSISVIIPAHDAERFLGDALDSVAEQRYQPVEVIVVDDGSTDATASVAHDHALAPHIVSQSQSGPGAARNRGIERASGNLIAFLDADDLWPAQKLARQVAVLVDEPGLDIVLGRIQYEALEGAVIPDLRYDDPDAKTLSNVHLGSGLYRRHAFERVGNFDESLRFSEDHDWFLRARELGIAITVLPDVTLIYRIHSTNMTLGRTINDIALTQVLKRSLDRRRAAGTLDDLQHWDDRGVGQPR